MVPGEGRDWAWSHVQRDRQVQRRGTRPQLGWRRGASPRLGIEGVPGFRVREIPSGDQGEQSLVAR